MHRFPALVGILSLLLLSAIPAKGAVSYTVTDLGNFSPTGMNANGDVVGWVTVAPTSSDFHPVLYSNGVLKDLGTFGGQSAIPYGINDSGQVVGQIEELDGTYHAFLYQNGAVIDLNFRIDPKLGLILNVAGGINNKGQIAGLCRTATGNNQVFLYDNGSTCHYAIPGLDNVIGLNDNGQIIGNAISQIEPSRGFLISNGSITDISVSDAKNTGVAAINSNGNIAGNYTDSNDKTHAFVYNEGNIIDIDTLNEITVALLSMIMA